MAADSPHTSDPVASGTTPWRPSPPLEERSSTLGAYNQNCQEGPKQTGGKGIMHKSTREARTHQI